MAQLTYFSDEVFGVCADLDSVLGSLWPADWRMLDQIIHLVLVRVVKWRDTNYHLIDEDAKRPPVEGFVMSATDNHLRR